MIIQSGSLAEKLADAAHFAAREADTAQDNARAFGHEADRKNASFYRSLALAYFRLGEALSSGLSLKSAVAGLPAPRGLDEQTGRAYRELLALVSQGEITRVEMSRLVPSPYKLP